jgi:hypothetical protein
MPNLRGAASELARVLASGGTLFVSVVGVPLRSTKLPTAFATRNVTDALEGAGLAVERSDHHRLAWYGDLTKH